GSCRDHRVSRTRRCQASLVELRRQVHVASDEPRKDEFLAKIEKLTARSGAALAGQTTRTPCSASCKGGSSQSGTTSSNPASSSSQSVSAVNPEAIGEKPR